MDIGINNITETLKSWLTPLLGEEPLHALVILTGVGVCLCFKGTRDKLLNIERPLVSLIGITHRRISSKK